MSKCPACAATIPSGAETCPTCGISLHQAIAGALPTKSGKWSLVSILSLLAGGGFVAMLICGGVLAALLLPAVQQARGARRTQCKNNLKMIGLALHNYHDEYKCFPPAYIADETGQPMHSWRVLLLPFLDQQPLYSQYRFDEPWDGPNNSRLLSAMPPVYRCPSDESAVAGTATAYAGVAGPNSIFRGAAPVSIRDIKDGTSNTIAIGEVKGAAIPWLKPQDVDVTTHPSIGDRDGFGSMHAGGCHVLLGDGSVRFLSENIALPTLQALYTFDGGEPVGDF